MLLFGGLHGVGNTALGWRFLNVVIGSLECVVLYAFAKRLTGKTWLAAAGARCSRSTASTSSRSASRPARSRSRTLALVVLYALYRYLLAAQVRVKPIVPGGSASLLVRARHRDGRRGRACRGS